jgi:hypothetical protein
MLMNLQWYYRIFMFPNIIDQPLVLQKYPNVGDWLVWQQILHILENSPPKLSTSQYRSKSPASWAQMEILQWSKLSIKSPCLWACRWACTCPHAEFWAILKVTHCFYSLFFPSNLQLNCLPCYHHHQDLATSFLIHTYLLLSLNVQKQQQQLLFLLLFLVCF